MIDGRGQHLCQGQHFAGGGSGELVGAHGALLQTEETADLAGDGHVVAGDHLHLDAVVLHVGNDLPGIVAGRVVKGNEPQQFQRGIAAFASHGQGAITLGGQLINRIVDFRHFVLGQLGHPQQHLRCTLHGDEVLALLLDPGLGALADGIEGCERELCITLPVHVG